MAPATRRRRFTSLNTEDRPTCRPPCGAVVLALNDRLIYFLATGSFERPNLPRSCKSTRNSPRRARICHEQAARTVENEDKYHLNPLIVKLGCLEPGDPNDAVVISFFVGDKLNGAASTQQVPSGKSELSHAKCVDCHGSVRFCRLRLTVGQPHIALFRRLEGTGVCHMWAASAPNIRKVKID